MFTNLQNNKIFFIVTLLTILMIGGFLRFYNFNITPPSLTWDEVSVGYNGWSVFTNGKDEWGNFFPLVFKSFREFKNPTHIYITGVSTKIFGLNDFAVRFPAALFGILNIFLIFVLGWVIFKNSLMGLFSAFILAISPYAIHFSRFNHELQFTIFFFMMAVVIFLKSLKQTKLIPISFLFFGITLITYNSAKIVVPLLVIILAVFYFKDLWKAKISFVFGVLIFLSFAILIILTPGLLGIERARQNFFSDKEITQTYLANITDTKVAGLIEIAGKQYIMHFSPRYLFYNGGSNPRLSLQNTGQFYLIEALFLIVGLVAIIIKPKKIYLFLIAWALLAPIPSSLAKEAPHAARAMFMVGSWHLIAVLGFFTLTKLVLSVHKAGKVLAGAFLFFSFISYIYFSFAVFNNYFQNYSNRYPHDWQYGIKEVIEYVKKHPEYTQVYMTNIRSQPYIFFLYYLQYPLTDYLKTVEYNNNQNTKSFNLVATFDKYYFDNWDPIESTPTRGNLYIISSSHYDGLKYKNRFDVKKIIKNPDGGIAFYIISI